MKYPALITVLCVTTSLSGCSSYNDLKNNTAPDTTLEASVPNTWKTSDVSSAAIDTGWLNTFADSKLKKISEQVLKHNYDIQVAAARLESAQATAKKAGAALLPAVNLNLNSQNSGNVSGDTSPGSIGASLDVSWELDVWGRIRAGRDEARSDLRATQADFNYAKQSLVAQATKAYFLAIEAGQQERYAQEVYDNYKKSLEVTEAFFKQGMVSKQDIHLAKSELARSEDALEKAKNAKTQALRSLELLLGKYPSGEYEVANQLPTLPKQVPAGVPSEILERRPDLVAADARVAAAFGRTTQAKAARLPRISLTSSFGGSSSALNEIADPTNVFWNLASNLIAPVFDGGQRKADVEIATAAQKEAVATYKKAALDAFGDVENALSIEQTLLKRVKALGEAYKQAQAAEKITETKYQTGEGQLLDVQQIKRQTISANMELLRAKQELLSERVNLHLALGGDFSG